MTVGGVGDGFLGLNTDHISVHHLGSTGTSILAHSAMLTRSSASGSGVTGGAPYDLHWLTQEGVVVPSTRTSVVTFPTSYTSHANVPLPIVILNNQFFNNWNVTCILQGSVTTMGFTAVQFGATPVSGFGWRAEGQINL